MVAHCRDLCKTIGVPPFTGEMSEGQRGRLQDDQAKNATDKSFATVSLHGAEPCAAMQSNYGCAMASGDGRGGHTNQTAATNPNNQYPQNQSPSFKSHKSQFRQHAKPSPLMPKGDIRSRLELLGDPGSRVSPMP